jgi:hypothetical protein
VSGVLHVDHVRSKGYVCFATAANGQYATHQLSAPITAPCVRYSDTEYTHRAFRDGVVVGELTPCMPSYAHLYCVVLRTV